MRAIGLLFFGFGAFAAVFGQDLLTNPIFGMFYVWWWVGLPVASLLLGPVWRAVSPVRTVNAFVARISGGDPDRGVFTYSPRVGYWPAALGLLAFVWIELVYPHGTELGPVRLWCAVYVAAMLIGGALFGNTFFEHADPFEVYSSLVAKLSVWARARAGRRRRAAGPQPAGQPLDGRAEARPGRRGGRRCSAARRSTRSATPRPG